MVAQAMERVGPSSLGFLLIRELLWCVNFYYCLGPLGFPQDVEGEFTENDDKTWRTNCSAQSWKARDEQALNLALTDKLTALE